MRVCDISPIFVLKYIVICINIIYYGYTKVQKVFLYILMDNCEVDIY